MFSKRLHWITLTGLAVWFVAGCEKEEIRSYKVPKAAPPQAGRQANLTYITPAGWQEDPNPRPPRVAAFLVTEGNRDAEVTVIPLAGNVGGLLANVNRWREEVGLEKIKADQLAKHVKPLDLAAAPAHYVEFIGPDSAADKRLATLGVIAPRGEQTWFFKLKGPADLVVKQKTAFDSFVRSVQFGGKRGDNDG